MSITQPQTKSVRLQVADVIQHTIDQTGKTLEFWDEQTLEAFSLQALQISLPHAATSRFYQKRFAHQNRNINSLATFKKLPFTWPEEVKNCLYDLLACPWEEISQVNMSSGTTGGPTTYVAYTEDDLQGDGAYYAPGGLFQFGRSDLVFVAVPYDMATVGLSIHRDIQRQGGAVLPAGKGGTYSSPERLVQAIHDLRPTTLVSTPSYAFFLHGLYQTIFPDEPRTIAHLRVGGEGASPAMLQRLGQLWQGDVRLWYGSTEIGIIAYTCEQGDYHVTAGNTYLEIVDDTGNVVPRGQIGKVVLTTLGRVGTPIVRYQSGDRGILLDADCPCGRSLPRLRIFGRMTDQIVADGNLVSPYLLEQKLLTIVPQAEPWYHIALRDNGIVLVAERPPIDPEELGSATRELRIQIKQASGLELANVEWAEIGTLYRPRTKMRRVLDERSKK